MSDPGSYQKGYAAGKRYADRSERDRERMHQERLARYSLAAAIAPAIIQNPWGSEVNGKWVTKNTADGIASTVARLVRAIESKL